MYVSMGVVLGVMACLTGTPAEQHDVYMRGMQVYQLDYEADLVTCIDSVGIEWEFYGCFDYAEGDIVCCLMDNMGTPDSIFDDTVVFADYSGYWVD